ncbi:MAG: hypothetical protein ACOYYS_10015 [Chloroflexota bacterium]
MTERASIFQNAQIGLETTPGTAVAALKVLGSLMVTMGMQFETSSYRPSGYRFKTVVAPNKEWASSKISGPISYSEIPYLLESLIKTVTATTPGGGTDSRSRVYAPTTKTADTKKTWTLEQGDQTRAQRVTNGLVTGLTFNFTRNECTIDGTLLSKALVDDIHLSTNAQYTLTANASPPTAGDFTLTFGGQTTSAIAYNATAAAVEAALEALSTVGTGNVEVTRTTGTTTLAEANAVYTVEFVNDLAQAPRTLTGTFTGLTASGSIALASSVTGVTPTELEAIPVLPTHICIYMADAQADLDAADPLERVLSCSWGYTDVEGALWTLNRDVASFAVTVPTEPKLEFKIKMAADDEGMTPLTNIRAGSTKFFRIEAIGDVIEGAITYELTIDIAVKFQTPTEFADEEGVYALEWTAEGVHDATWGKATELTVVNDIASL